ncbi:diacylglycerol kinase family protein [Galbitalea soli]|uniref:Diacylglycerol kinase n=1 Tax=Galbitalea soli TaxID=1268042 RepID=A0A7C9PNF4_9MICO|nr:diacylglycerol kinase family protein [Galbitalea soli]NEM91486.1 diacylglycerol kinase [Galbitalea soli]NYJ30180.1 diacylglycerol kinase (ATP) [Galbitalea soli]
MTTTPKRLAVAINPSARFGASRGVGPLVVERLGAAGHEVTALLEADFATLQARASEVVAGRPDALILVGGDGMINLGTNLVAGTGVPLGIIPSGTGNDMARSLGIPIENAEAAIAALLAALELPPRVIDAVRVRDDAGNTRWYGCMLSAGFDSLVNERANRMRRPRGKSRYTIAMLLELATLEPLSYRITLDGEVLETRGLLVSVGNGVSLGGGMKVTPDALLDDGLVDVLVVGAMTRRRFLSIYPRVFAGTHVREPEVSIHRARTVRLEAEGVVAYTDGERFSPLPVDIVVEPGALAVYAPPRA